MNIFLFKKVKDSVVQWLKDNNENFKSKGIVIEVIKDTEDCLIIDLKFGENFACIIVEMPSFAPYRFVCFEMGDIVNGAHEMIYAWYDNESNTIEDIIENLNKSISTVLKYNDKISQQK